MVQKKKSDEQDVLVVRDEKTGEISVVAGLSTSCSSLFFFCTIIVNF